MVFGRKNDGVIGLFRGCRGSFAQVSAKNYTVAVSLDGASGEVHCIQKDDITTYPQRLSVI